MHPHREDISSVTDGAEALFPNHKMQIISNNSILGRENKCSHYRLVLNNQN